MEQKTHYRKAFNSPYLSSADIVEPVMFTIQHVKLLKDETKKTKDLFNTAFWVEKELRPGEALKPMILNATNSRKMKILTGSPYIEDWGGTQVIIFVDKNVRFGRDTVEGLRIEKPLQKPDLLPGTPAWTNAIAAYQRDKNLDAVEKRMTISDENKAALIEEANHVA